MRASAPNWLADKRVQIVLKVTKGGVTYDVKATPHWPKGSTLTCLQRSAWRGHYDGYVGGQTALHHGQAIADAADMQGLFA